MFKSGFTSYFFLMHPTQVRHTCVMACFSSPGGDREEAQVGIFFLPPQ
jgi:hypothetical protein